MTNATPARSSLFKKLTDFLLILVRYIGTKHSQELTNAEAVINNYHIYLNEELLDEFHEFIINSEEDDLIINHFGSDDERRIYDAIIEGGMSCGGLFQTFLNQEEIDILYNTSPCECYGLEEDDDFNITHFNITSQVIGLLKYDDYIHYYFKEKYVFILYPPP
jgi:hypothetical protein